MTDVKPKRPKFGGRKKGTPNKKSTLIEEKCKELGCDPAEILMRFCLNDEKGLGYTGPRIKMAPGGVVIEEPWITSEMRLKAASELMEYLYAKRKAVEVTGEDGGPIESEVTITTENILELIAKAK